MVLHLALFGTTGFTSYSVQTNTFKIIHLGTCYFFPGLEWGDYSTELGLCDISSSFLLEEDPDNLYEDLYELY